MKYSVFFIFPIQFWFIVFIIMTITSKTHNYVEKLKAKPPNTWNIEFSFLLSLFEPSKTLYFLSLSGTNLGPFRPNIYYIYNKTWGNNRNTLYIWCIWRRRKNVMSLREACRDRLLFDEIAIYLRRLVTVGSADISCQTLSPAQCSIFF